MRRLENLSWGEALEYAKRGCAIQRAGWRVLNQFISYTPDQFISPNELWGEANKQHFQDTNAVKIKEYFTHKTTSDMIIVGWQPLELECEAKDWQVVDPVTYKVLGYE